jgi:hypothetical protein
VITVSDELSIAPAPDGIDLAIAGAAPLAGITAMTAIDALDRLPDAPDDIAMPTVPPDSGPDVGR